MGKEHGTLTANTLNRFWNYGLPLSPTFFEDSKKFDNKMTNYFVDKEIKNLSVSLQDAYDEAEELL